MRLSLPSLLQNRFLPGGARISPNISWLVILPAGIWGIATVYLPILGGTLTPAVTAAITFLIILLVAISLLCHILGHRAAAQLFRADVPEKISVFLFGDTAQIWPPSPSIWQVVLVAFSAPFINILLAGLAYLVWNAQLNIYLNLSMPFIGIFNAWLAIINFAPVFPFDGGRVINAIVNRASESEPNNRQWIVRLGFWATLAEVAWGIFLIVQNDRYSLETGIATIFMALLAAFGLIQQPNMKLENAIEGGHPDRLNFWGVLTSGIVFLILAVISSSLLMTNNGLEAPGVALSVESMVIIPAQYRHQPAGTFLLTSVIQQSPIPAGIWMIGQFTPVLNILPPEKITPNQVSPQESARQGFQMLDQSETTATVVGLQLAGFNATQVGKGAGVASILADSPAQGVLLTGDIITGMNGNPVHTAQELIDKVKTLTPLSKVQLSVRRDQQTMDLAISLMAPASPGGSPRIGIAVQDAGFDYSLPIPVKIVPQKIIGGPSAGLMFTLTLYNMLIPNDLTQGLRIAGTGTINPDGSVGPIGGVQQKVAAAEDAGAVYFLAPADNYADALSVARKIKVIKVATVEDAIAFLRSLSVK